MSNNETGSNRRSNKSRERRVELRDSYDTIPQPKGEFKDLFTQMQNKQSANNKRSTVKDKPSK